MATMKPRAWLCGVGMTLVLTAAGGALTACGGQGAKFGNIKAGDMPENETWVGVYYNPVYGHLHMIEQDTNIVGRWKRTDSSHWGELSGTAEGNVVHFTWKEHAYGALGPSSESHGTGVFVYKMGENKTAELDGQYSLEDSDSVGQWHCVKQVGMKADINSINGDNPQDTAPAAGDKWN
jgi:hypothetical protein